jgi:hypothetical protein
VVQPKKPVTTQQGPGSRITNTDYPYPDFTLPARDYSFSGIMNGTEDFTLTDETPWDSPFDLLLPPSDSTSLQSSTNPVLRNPYNAHLALFEGYEDFATGTSGPSGSTSQTDSTSKSASSEPRFQSVPYVTVFMFC